MHSAEYPISPSVDFLPRTRVIIPTYNAEAHFPALAEALIRQDVVPRQILIVDSSSRDNTVGLFRDFGATVHVIPQADFNHGGTRRLATQIANDCDFFIFLTQDAIPFGDGALRRIMSAFGENNVGMAYGRQLPRAQAGAVERHARLLNYPEHSETRDFNDRARYGVKTVFCSDSFAAYRKAALLEAGGFPEDAFFAEDQIVAGRMLLGGWRLAYVASACAVHSHQYSPVQDFRRYFDVGVFHGRNHWLLEKFGSAEGEGLKFALSELRYLSHSEPWSIPSAIARTFLKYAGYRLGRLERVWPARFNRFFSMAPWYWKT